MSHLPRWSRRLAIMAFSVACVQAQAAPPPIVTARCAACHSFEAGKRSFAGPNLLGVSGRVAGTAPGFAFSPALKASAITWDDASLDRFLAKPGALVPGTRMVIAIPDPADRAKIIAYLKTLK